MALFSDNPFTSVFRAQKQREAEREAKIAKANQQAAEEQKQQIQKANIEKLKATAEFRAKNPGVMELNNLAKSNQFYRYGLGGGSAWTSKLALNLSSGKIESKTPTLDPRKYITPDSPYRGFGDKRMMAPKVIPAGASGKQEYKYLTEGRKLGVDVVEAPEEFRRGKGISQLDRTDTFYSTSTGKAMGTLMGRGSYRGFGNDATKSTGAIKYEGQVNDNRSGIKYEGSVSDKAKKIKAAKAQQKIPSSSMGMTGSSPLAFTGFGLQTGFAPSPTSTIEDLPIADSPFSGRFGYGASYGSFYPFLFAQQY